MNRFACAGLSIVALLGSALATAQTRRPPVSVPAEPASFAEHQRQCAGKDGWSDPAPPIRVFGNVYDVGTCGIVALLVTGPAGHVLIDAATAEAAPSILANVRRLGIRPHDIKYLLSSHEHLDHAGGFRAIQRATGATMVATAAARAVLQSGIPGANDPQHGGLDPFPGLPVGRVVRDGEVVQLGPLRFTAHTTPGHAPGSTSWSWRSCSGATCHAVVYADSVSAISADGYRFSDHPAYVAAFRATLDKIARLPCDLVITPHPAASGLYQRLAGTTPLASAKACVDYAEAGRTRLDERLASETRAPARR